MVRSAKRVSNHEAEALAFILRDAAARLLRMRRCTGLGFAHE